MEVRKFKHLLSILLVLATYVVNAQCSMCKAVAESNLDGGGAVAAGLNNGIMYLMAFPYFLMATVAFLWYRHRKSKSA